MIIILMTILETFYWNNIIAISWIIDGVITYLAMQFLWEEFSNVQKSPPKYADNAPCSPFPLAMQ